MCMTAPSFTQRAVNFFRAMGRVGVRLATGQEVQVDDLTYERRLSICEPCPRRDGKTCQECGCLVTLKAALVSEECPLGHWPQPIGGGSGS